MVLKYLVERLYLRGRATKMVKTRNMQNVDKITVVVPIYNNRLTLSETLRSVLRQTYHNIEVLLVDDGSSETYDDILQTLASSDERVKFFKLPHKGANTARNYGMAKACGSYIAMLDADDLWLPTHLEESLHALRSSGADGVYGGVIIRGADGKDSEFRVYAYNKRIPVINYLLSTGFGAQTSTLFMTAESARNVRWDETLFRHQDYDFIVRYARRYKLAPKPHPTTIYCQTQKNGGIDFLSCMRFIKANRQDVIPELYRNYCSQMMGLAQQCGASDEEAGFYRLESETAESTACPVQFEKPTDLARLTVPVTGNKLTLIVPFLNEREEVLHTVQSARHWAGGGVDVIVINDHSTDCYDYRADLQNLDVTYIYNKERLGVAASRNLGVRLCTTPYFLLLDAHMRFYDGQWADTIIRLLEEDDRCVLCSQTLCLSKKDGAVIEKKDVPVTYGAYMPLSKGAYMPDIKWNASELCPGKNVEPVPAVLGAGYAASKRYWSYLKGLEGLCYYGCDEIYLSLKTWLEGGRCLLLKDVVIGHIYRDNPPYRHYSDLEVFNYLLIAQTVLPASWRGLAFATAKVRYPAVYEKALAHLEKEKVRVQELQAYYRHIFTVPFAKVLQMNRRCALHGQETRMKHLERLSPVSDFVLAHRAEGHGLYEGQMGQLVWMCHCMDDARREDAAVSLWNSVWKAVRAKQLPHNFKYGLEGIGWALVYLHEKGLIEDDITEYLQTIDEQLNSYDPEADADDSLLTGRGGWMAYQLARAVYFNLAEKGSFPTSRERRKIEAVVTGLLTQSGEATVLSYAWQMHWLLTEPVRKDDFTLELHDWMDFGDFIPNQPEYWSAALTGNALSSTLYGKLIKESIHENSQ